MLAILLAHDQTVLYLSGRAVHRAAGGYRGEGKSDARDAAIIADQARMRRDLAAIRPGDEITVELKMLTARRADLVADRTRALNRLREQLLSIFPALERCFDYSHCKGALTLLTGYQTPAAIRRVGAARLERWLSARKTRNAHTLARRAIEAATSQQITLPGEALGAQIVQTLAQQVLELHAQIGEIDKLIAARFHQHPDAAIIESLSRVWAAQRTIASVHAARMPSCIACRARIARQSGASVSILSARPSVPVGAALRRSLSPTGICGSWRNLLRRGAVLCLFCLSGSRTSADGR